MKIPFEIGGCTLYLEQYNTFQEKEILLLDSFEVHSVDAVFDILNFNCPEGLTQDEKKIILYKFREISLGDEVNVKFICEECGQGNDGILEAGNFIIEPERNDLDIKKINQIIQEDNLQDYVDINLDELPIIEYEKLKKRIQQNQSKINFIKSAFCLKCKKERKFDLSSLKYIIEIMSDDTLMTLYKVYNQMIFFGHYSKLDIDSMYPFERSVLIGLLNKTKDDLAK